MKTFRDNRPLLPVLFLEQSGHLAGQLNTGGAGPGDDEGGIVLALVAQIPDPAAQGCHAGEIAEADGMPPHTRDPEISGLRSGGDQQLAPAQGLTARGDQGPAVAVHRLHRVLQPAQRLRFRRHRL